MNEWLVEHRERLGCQNEIPLEKAIDAYVYASKCLLLLGWLSVVLRMCFQMPNEYVIDTVYLSRVQFEKFNYSFFPDFRYQSE